MNEPIESQLTVQRIDYAIAAFRQGRPVIFVNDFEDDDEADLVVAAERLSEPVMEQLLKDCRKIVCLCLTEELITKLQLSKVGSLSQRKLGTSSTFGVDAKFDVKKGDTAADIVTTVAAVINPKAVPSDLVRPGHVIPICAASGGIWTQLGRAEAAIELARLADLKPASVLCRMKNPDGTKVRGIHIYQYAARNDMQVISVDDLIAYRYLKDRIGKKGIRR